MPPSHSLAAADTKTRGARAAHLLDICAYSLRAQACGQSCNAKRVESSLLRQALPPIHCCSESRFFQGPESAWPVQNTSAQSRARFCAVRQLLREFILNQQFIAAAANEGERMADFVRN